MKQKDNPGGSPEILSRRDLIAVLGGTAVSAAWPTVGSAQNPNILIAYLSAGKKDTSGEYIQEFVGGMTDHGYVEGRQYRLETRFAETRFDALAGLAGELVQLNPRAIVAAGPPPVILALRQATQAIPIVCTAMGSEQSVRLGLIESVAHPGGNVTGMSILVDGMTGKLVEVARDLIPSATSIGLLSNSADVGEEEERAAAQAAATRLAVKLVPSDVHSLPELAAGIQTFVSAKVSVVLVGLASLFLNERKRVADLAMSARMPTVFGFREQVEAGGLLSYGVDLRANTRRTADYVVKILEGAKPGDLPIEFPTKLEMIINMKTATALGIAISPTIMLRADEVIE